MGGGQFSIRRRPDGFLYLPSSTSVYFGLYLKEAVWSMGRLQHLAFST